MKKIFLFFISLLTINCYCQIAFEKGYYIDNSGQKTECFIKNNDWAGNPTDFKYKLSENDEVKTITIVSVKEFGIYNVSKYIRATVQIDMSNENINDISTDKNPEFKKVELLLKVLIEGKANLYAGGRSTKYFYNVENSNIEQLILKSFKNSENQIVDNNLFRKQLWDNLKCSSIDKNNLLKLEYNKSSLVNLFSLYNKCSNANFVDYTVKKQRDAFNLTVRPRLNSSSLTIQNEMEYYLNTDFQNKTAFGVGIEAEFILPFNKNKWSILTEPAYQTFENQKTEGYNNLPGEALKTYNVKYQSIEIPLGMRHYFFLNNNSKIFIDASLVYAFALDSKIEYRLSNTSAYNTLNIGDGLNMAFGIGYKLNNKYSIEMRYNTKRDILIDYTLWNSDYKTVSIILGYTIF